MAQQNEIKLNLGSGSTPIEGYQNLDISQGNSIFPLPYPDNSVDEIRASHVLEHFPHNQTIAVIQDWQRALKAGGILKIAVPDFKQCADMYSRDRVPEGFPLEGVIMGGHVDEHDQHHAIFDRAKLRDLFKRSGFFRIEGWKSEEKDCASLPISVNLQGIKATDEQLKVPKVAVCMSVPRLGFMDNFLSCFQFGRFGWPVYKYTGAFWGQCLERVLEDTMEKINPEFIITVDYDSVFDEDHIRELLYVMRSYPEVDACAPLQVSRGLDLTMFSIRGPEGNLKTVIDSTEFTDNDILEVDTAHFGLTIFRTEAFEGLRHPWFHGQPGADGRWGEDRTDDDIAFWKNWKKHGHNIHLATRVPIGHLELAVRWPSKTLQSTTQDLADWNKEHTPPKDVWT